MFFTPALLIVSAGFAAAQSISGQCTAALASVAGSSEAACLNPSGLVQLALLNSNTSVIPTISTWLPGMCSQGPCSNATLQAVVTNITNGCPTELQSLGLTTTDPTALATEVEYIYPTFRQVVCLKDTSVNSLCPTEWLTGIQNATTTLTLSAVVTLLTQSMSGQSIGIPQSVVCSDCSKAAYTIVATNLPSAVAGNQTTFQSECGTSFTDGQTPSEIQETASNSTTTTTTGGAATLSVSSLNVGAAMLVAVFSAFTIFA
ncbi:hypothetical protein BDN67DRAFT_990303 [Paxillus ammoniavirescens]|nr:hypothetical protein BDN67DRAFT_990303 [Paxillus ammoniavirescens]